MTSNGKNSRCVFAHQVFLKVLLGYASYQQYAPSMIFLPVKHDKAFFIRLQSYNAARFDLFWKVLEQKKEPNMAANSLMRRPKEPTDGLTDSQKRSERDPYHAAARS